MVRGIRKEAFSCEKYVSGKSMDQVMADYGLSEVIKLGSNENPYGPYQTALTAMISEVSKINIYPEKNYIRLKELLAEKHGVLSENICLGHGAGNVLDMVAKTLLEEGDEVLVPKESYRLYREISKIMGASVKEVSLRDDYTIHLDDFKEQITEKTKIIWICNPNNPTGTVIDKQSFKGLVDAMPENCWLVIDEAYAEFADQSLLPNSVDFIKSSKQVISIHTFSKYYGLAGGRVGYLIANSEFANWYDTVSEPFNSNRIGLAGAVSLIENMQDCLKYGDIMNAERQRLNEELSKLGCICEDSQANFVFFKVPFKASEISEVLLQDGVIVRACDGFGYDMHLRVSIGTVEQNDKFLASFSKAVCEMNKGVNDEKFYA